MHSLFEIFIIAVCFTCSHYKVTNICSQFAQYFWEYLMIKWSTSHLKLKFEETFPYNSLNDD